MTSENIFSALGKYNSATDENYLTEAFVFLMNSLLERERYVDLEILTRLCVQNNDFRFDMDEVISVSTQEVTEQGTPDIRVSSPNKLIYVEVKHDSPVDPEQLKRYKKHLDSSSATIKRLILLTKFPVDFNEHQGIPDKHARWFEVYNWLANSRVQDSVCSYLIESFKSFLEVKGMSIQKVGWEYINGVPALNNLINMIEAAIQGASVPLYGKSAGWDFKGFYLENKDFWCGIYYSEPVRIIFEVADKKKFNAKLVDTPSYSVGEDKYCIWFRFPLEDSPFFSLNKDKQLEEITKFVKTAYKEAQQMRIESKSTKQSHKLK
jgi:hypothetical protein